MSLKKRYYNYDQSFQNKNHSNNTTLSSYVRKIKKTNNKTLTLISGTIPTSAPYTIYMYNLHLEVTYAHIFNSICNFTHKIVNSSKALK